MFNKKTVKDIDVSGKKVLVRASLNVPINNGQVGDRSRLKALVPTLSYLLDKNAALILISHHSTDDMSLEPVAPVLSEMVGRKVEFVHACVGNMVNQKVAQLQPGQIVLLENLRFHPEEEANDEDFARELAELAELYVDDDFTVMHRQHASVVSVPKFLPAVAGLQVEQEVSNLTRVMRRPEKPLLLVVGGAKISTKIEFLNFFLDRADAIFIGGAMANTFLAANGHSVGKSKYDRSEIELAKKIEADAKAKNVEIFIPTDVVVTTDISTSANLRTTDVKNVKDNEIIADVGPESVKQINELLKQKGTVIWNGPLGITEEKAFQSASLGLAKAVIESGATSIVGGGDTAAFVDVAGLAEKFSYVSTGGGASLELMAGKELPGLEVLLDKD